LVVAAVVSVDPEPVEEPVDGIVVALDDGFELEPHAATTTAAAAPPPRSFKR
jgi:hypothetical protein